ncbi:pilus assembly protein CpaB [Anoxybacillus voinovskiensis]|uniref:Pilus assembly protein CpaB n=1 Tax=Anoxybacteroides voinovskiense TaxID=230470 RepID=A0A840DSX8_9BACL|nr:Flp pilus assembly protein CpaB [Anoxybacillus voinovskiensis]MBB4073377.1 pilus assembly protein CpaB [Anoxybacillus voinovskiensis]GGJ61748.1 Flp pilus assembly protein CpaB [Anoxybacillus voinovskiensis]
MRAKMIFVLALVMGAITTVLFFQYMKQLSADKNEQMVTVVAAREDIKENEQISRGMLQLVQIPKKGLPPNAVYHLSELEGMIATSDIKKGEVLLKHRVRSWNDETTVVSRKVREGFRAVSVGVNFVQSVSNLIEPEDKVDVIFSETIKLPNNQIKVETKQLLSGVRVLAVGRKIAESLQQKEPHADYNSVTLELKPEDAVLLINASERGHIQLTLHTKVISSDEAK